MQTRIAVQRKIDSVWTLIYTDHGDGTATVHRYSRNIQLGYDLEDFGFGENVKPQEDSRGERILTHLVRRNDAGKIETLKVMNPKHIFSYGAHL